MFNNDLLLSGGEKKLDGIWEITVGNSGSNYGYSKGSYGSVNKLDPSPFIYGTNEEAFSELSSIKQDPPSGSAKNIYLSFSLHHEPNLTNTEVFVHVKKENAIFSSGVFYFDLNRSSCRTSGDLFNYSNVGKTYRMYIGPLDTPPRGSKPLFFKQLFNLQEGCLDVQQGFTFHQRRINCRCHRYCRYLSRWSNRIRQIVRTSFTGGNQSHQTSDWRRNYGFVSGLCNIGRIIYNGSIRQYLFQRYETFSHRVPDGRNVSTLWRFVLSLCASHTMGGAYA